MTSIPHAFFAMCVVLSDDLQRHRINRHLSRRVSFGIRLDEFMDMDTNNGVLNRHGPALVGVTPPNCTKFTPPYARHRGATSEASNLGASLARVFDNLHDRLDAPSAGFRTEDGVALVAGLERAHPYFRA